MSVFVKLRNLDRRLIFLLIFVGVAIPLFFTIGFNVETTENVAKVYDLVEKTPEGTPVMFSFDYDPSTKPEIHPMAKVVIYHALERKLKIICTALWPMGVQMCGDIFNQLKKEYPNLKYGKDYVNLGYKSGGMVTIQAMATNFRVVFPTDVGGIPVDKLPIMDGIHNFERIGFVFSLSAGDPGIINWIMVVHDAYGRPVAGGTTAVSAPSILPYVNQQKQLTGLLGGLKGAAEYEKLIHQPGTATSGMDAQSIAHLIIIGLIVLGNIGYFVTKKSEQKR